MTNVDQFESVFKAAAKERYQYRPVQIRRVLVVTDFGRPRGEDFAAEVRSFLDFLEIDPAVDWKLLTGGDFGSVRELLDIVERDQPDLICTYRNLHSQAWKWPYTLGEYIDLLTQVTTIPVLLCPHPESGRGTAPGPTPRATVMALTDDLTGDSSLVDWALAFTRKDGVLWLTHIEDRAVFERYVDAISKIPAIDTDTARELIGAQLLKEPSDYVQSCGEALVAAKQPIHVRGEVGLGHRLSDCLRLVEERKIELLVFNTKDDDQLAMHGLAYPLAVELRRIPLLML